MGQNEAKEIKLSDFLSIYSRTDLLGKITYVNNYFREVSGYSEAELIGSPHNIIRHPDMPKVIFKLMWARLKQNKDILALVKNRAKNGDYYWVTTLFEIKFNPITNKPESYLAIRRAAPRKAIKTIIPLYETLIDIEKKDGVEASERYLKDYLYEKGTDYDTFMKDLVNYKGIVAKFFNSVRHMFD